MPHVRCCEWTDGAQGDESLPLRTPSDLGAAVDVGSGRGSAAASLPQCEAHTDSPPPTHYLRKIPFGGKLFTCHRLPPFLITVQVEFYGHYGVKPEGGGEGGAGPGKGWVKDNRQKDTDQLANGTGAEDQVGDDQLGGLWLQDFFESKKIINLNFKS